MINTIKDIDLRNFLWYGVLVYLLVFWTYTGIIALLATIVLKLLPESDEDSDDNSGSRINSPFY